MKRRVVLLILVGIAGVLYGLQPPSWELTGDIPVALTAYDVVETPSGALLAAIAEWTSGSHALVYRSTDGGDTWTGTLYPVLFGGSCWDLEINASGRVYASANLSNGVEQRLYYSDDDGVTWSQLTMRIPLNEIFRGSNSTTYLPVGLKCHDNKLYVFGRSKGSAQGPLFHGEVWIYDEIALIWSKWDLVDLNADEGGWTIETGPGPGAGTYLYLGTYNTGTVIRSTSALASTKENSRSRRTAR